MRQAAFAIQGFAALLLATAAAAQGAKPLAKCAPDAVVSGSVCIDRYEASVWRVTDPTGLGLPLVTKIRQGKVTQEELLAGARQLGSVDDYEPCKDNGEGCGSTAGNVFAVSLKGVAPSRHVTWFQALQACKNSRKRLPTSAEWQQAVAGTQDPGDDFGAIECNTASGGTVAPTGSRESCVSTDGAFDMVGNVSEWVADQVPLSVGDFPTLTPCGAWSTGDEQCLNEIQVTSGGAGVLQRGGGATSGTAAGPLALRDAEPGIPTTTTTTTTTTTLEATTTTTDPSVPTTTTTTTTTTAAPTTTTTTTLPPLVNVGFRCVR